MAQFALPELRIYDQHVCPKQGLQKGWINYLVFDGAMDDSGDSREFTEGFGQGI